MSNYQKFMFDNFVIADEDEPDEEVVELKNDEVDVIRVEAPEEENEPIIDIPVEPAAPEVKTYTQEELDAAVLQAEQAGYEKGYNARDCGLDKEITTLLGNVESKLLDIIVNAGTVEEKLEKQFKEFNILVLQKLIPGLQKEQGVAIINKFIEDNFANFRFEPKLSFYLNSEVIGQVQEKIAQMAHIHDFEGKIALHKDDNLGISDCRIEWENGGVEHLSNKLLEKVENLLEEEAPKN